ncbi:MAG TPA: SMP-30/gluconolactonase/LRE family protein [Pseudonocardiaceae bacterium]|nr:SMP-30/gluconolactonase/LRE family protein [Pseudonocardiaceae bacterium]
MGGGVRAHPVSDRRAMLGESPLWDDTVGLRWLDITGQRLYTADSELRLSHRVTAIEHGQGGALLAVTTDGFGWLDPTTGAVRQRVTVPVGAGVTMNDGAIDPCGRCWAGSATRGGTRRGVLYRLVHDVADEQATGIGMSNGIDWSPDGSTMYHVDSTAGTVTAWRYDLVTGGLGAARVLRTVPPSVGTPDGLTVDTDGFVWLAVWGAGEVWRLDPTGRTVATISVPTPLVSSCAFGGAGLDTLYITTATRAGDPASGLLYATEVAARGRPPRRFADTTGNPASNPSHTTDRTRHQPPDTTGNPASNPSHTTDRTPRRPAGNEW